MFDKEKNKKNKFSSQKNYHIFLIKYLNIKFEYGTQIP